MLDATVAITPARTPSVAVTEATMNIAATGARFSGPAASNGMLLSQPTAVSMKTTSTHQGTQRLAAYCNTCGSAARSRASAARSGGVNRPRWPTAVAAHRIPPPPPMTAIHQGYASPCCAPFSSKRSRMCAPSAWIADMPSG